jgi:hypothetical protein
MMEGIHIKAVDNTLLGLASERLDSLTKPRGAWEA